MGMWAETRPSEVGYTLPAITTWYHVWGTGYKSSGTRLIFSFERRKRKDMENILQGVQETAYVLHKL